jgi:hypothetical protein
MALYTFKFLQNKDFNLMFANPDVPKDSGSPESIMLILPSILT